jgi:hypothetical protein
MKINFGYEEENYIKRLFKGESHPFDCVDFQTEKCLYEVKSCQLFIKCTGGNSKRINGIKPETTQLGRFFIKRHNHISLKETAHKENKKALYVFVLVIGKEKIWKIKTWNQTNKLLKKRGEHNPIRIKEIFR